MGSTVALKVVVLAVLITINTSGLLISRHALSSSGADNLNINHMILATEIGKGLLSCVCEFIATRGNLIQSFRQNSIADPREALKPAIPSVLYLIQNILTYYAIPRVSPPVLQVTFQGKLIVTAIISYFLLDRRYTRQQYLCLLGVVAGVAIVVVEDSVDETKRTTATGLLAVGIASVLSAMTVAQSMVITAVLKYTDNVLKGIATCVSVCLCTALSSFFFGTLIGAQFVLGASLVLLSTYVFSNPIGKASFQNCPRRKPKSIFLYSYTAVSALWIVFYGSYFLTNQSGIQSLVFARQSGIKSLAFVPEPLDCHARCDKHLQQQCPEGELDYLKNYPDVADAVRHGAFNSGFHHFKIHGVKEDRQYLCDDAFTAQQHCLSSCVLTEEPQESRLANTTMFGLPPRSLNDTYFYSLPRYGGSCPGILDKCTVNYVRLREHVSQRGQQGNCATMLDVLQWLSPLMDKYDKTIVLTAGGLIKVLRDKTFFWEDGTPIDADIDFLASFDAFDFASRLEPIFWHKFGWTIRTFHNCDGYTVFMQLISACGHVLADGCDKSQQPEPGIEFYAMYEFKNAAVIGMLWDQEFFPAQLILPPRPHVFDLPGSNRKMDFYIPRHAEDFLTCVYGNWSVYASPGSYVSAKEDRNNCVLGVARQIGIYNETAKVIKMYEKYYIPRPDPS